MAGNPNWVKGRSANPSGRPKIPLEVIEMAKAHSPAAIEALARVMRGKRSPAAAVVSAATAILDRGYGKPTQPIDAKVSIFDTLSPDERIALDTALSAAIAAARDPADDAGGEPPTHH